jgi:hypothetical protein
MFCLSFNWSPWHVLLLYCYALWMTSTLHHSASTDTAVKTCACLTLYGSLRGKTLPWFASKMVPWGESLHMATYEDIRMHASLWCSKTSSVCPPARVNMVTYEVNPRPIPKSRVKFLLSCFKTILLRWISCSAKDWVCSLINIVNDLYTCTFIIGIHRCYMLLLTLLAPESAV